MPPSSVGEISCSPESLDADRVAGAPSGDPWLQRRHLLWGASDVPVLFAARGWLPPEALTASQRADLEPNRQGIPRYLARKAGLMAPKRSSGGEEQERPLLSLWLRWAEEHGVDPDSVRHASEWPREWMPLPDRYCPHLGATPDAFGRDIYDGSLVGIELKAPPDSDAWSRWGLRWTVQVQAQMGVMGASRALLVCGERWAIPPHEGPVTTMAIERDDAMIARCREAAADAWETVERLRKGRGA